MEADKTLSEIARSVLVSDSETDPRSLREKAGLLALLDLLGIMESFYGDAQSPNTSMNLLRSIAEAPASKEPDLASSMMSLASKVLGNTQGQGGLDPALISTLMGAVSALSKSRSLNPRPTGKAVALEVSEDDSAEGESGEEPHVTEPDNDKRDGAGTQTDTPEETAKPSPPSTLQQILGIDPRIITLGLNVLADLMKARNAAASDKQGAGQGTTSYRESSEMKTEVTVNSDGETVVIPTTKRQPRERLYHKPGLGIYRQKPQASSE